MGRGSPGPAQAAPHLTWGCWPWASCCPALRTGPRRSGSQCCFPAHTSAGRRGRCGHQPSSTSAPQACRPGSRPRPAAPTHPEARDGPPHLQQLRLPRVQGQGPHLGTVDAQAPGWRGGGRGVRARLGPRAPPGHPVVPPVDARALDAEQHAQVDAGPARVRPPAVATLAVPSHVLHSL